MSFENPALNREEELLINDLSKRAMTELTLGEKEVSVLLNKTIDTIKTMARERAYWEFKASCYAKDIARLTKERDELNQELSKIRAEKALNEMTKLDQEMGLL